MGGLGAKDICGVLDFSLGYLAADGAGQTVNTLRLILSDSENVLLFPALLLTPESDKAVWQKSNGRRGIRR